MGSKQSSGIVPNEELHQEEVQPPSDGEEFAVDNEAISSSKPKGTETNHAPPEDAVADLADDDEPIVQKVKFCKRRGQGFCCQSFVAQ